MGRERTGRALWALWMGLVLSGCQAGHTDPSVAAPPPEPSVAELAASLAPPPLEPLDPLDGAPALQPIPDPGAAPARPPRYRIDQALERFDGTLGRLRPGAPPVPTPPAPRAVRRAWSKVLAELDRYLAQPPLRTPAAELVRARFVLETELAASLGTWALPDPLVDRVRERLTYVDHRLSGFRDRTRSLGGEVPALAWPVSPVRINSPFGWRTDPFKRRRRFHFGVDLFGRSGQPVRAAAPGVVIWAGWHGGHGRHVEVMHPGGWVTRYSHLGRLLVQEGDRLRAGSALGTVGDSGRSTGPHLHFEVWRHGDARDPLASLGDPGDATPGDGALGGS